jgi:hypothetical protein
MYRLRNAIQSLKAGPLESPLTFRKTDFWQEVAVEFNEVAKELEELRLRNDELERQVKSMAGAIKPASPVLVDLKPANHTIPIAIQDA